MNYETILEVLEILMKEAKRNKVAFYDPIAIEYLGNMEDYTGEGQREVYRIERKV